MEPDADKRVELLAARADLARWRLSATLGALERRRRYILDVPLRLSARIAVLGAVAVVGVSGLVAYRVYRAATARSRGPHERWRAVQRIWLHPERAARPARTLLGSVAQGMLVAVVHSLATGLLTMAARSAERRHPALAEGDR